MARCLQLDDQDRAALRKLDDDFAITADGETATVAGEMEVEIVRPADDGGDRFWLTIRFPGGEELDVRIARSSAAGTARYRSGRILNDIWCNARQHLSAAARITKAGS